MLGVLISNKELEEMEYLLKREMDELLYDFKDQRIENIVKRAMEERYKILFGLYSKVASVDCCMKYIRIKKY